jgi:RNA polymerase sigma-70 factor, ECF subfamily
MISELETVRCVDQYWRGLRSFFFRRGVGYADCDDLVIESFLVLWQRRECVKPLSARSFLFGVARNILAAHRREITQRAALSRSLIAAEVAASRPEGTLPETEALEGLEELLNALAPRQQEVVRLNLNGMSFEEVGRLLGISGDTARTHHKRAIKKLRERARRVTDLTPF